MKVLLIGYVWPEPTSSAAGIRDLQLLRVFRRAGWEVMLASASAPTAASDQASSEWDALGVVSAPIALNDPKFDAWIALVAPDLVIFDRFVTEEQFGWRVRAHCPNAVRIIDTQDLHSLRRIRQQMIENGETDPDAILAARSLEDFEDTLRELAAIYRSDGALVLSDHEMRILTERLGMPAQSLFLCRYAYPPRSPGLGFAERKDFGFIGNFRHAPNWDAVQWLLSDIWPQIRSELTRAGVASRLRIAGAYPPREAGDKARQAGPDVVMEGPVPDAAAFLGSCRVNLAPLRFGAGIKGKITDGWWGGTPCVSTRLGAEGLCGDLPFGGWVEEDSVRFARAAVRMHQEPGLWAESADKGAVVLDRLHSESRNGPALVAWLQGRVSRMHELRRQNAIGRILWREQLRGTEYFSRWIELKERLRKAEGMAREGLDPKSR